MSGIAVIVDFTGKPVSEGEVARVTGAMPSRGPDGVRHWREGSVALGHCAMHTTPGAADAPQPLASADGRLVLAMDGYIANYEELRRDLLERGAVLRSSSDAELVLAAYETWGEAAPERMGGEYAFALWDAREGRLYAARDHQGLRPLFYHWSGEETGGRLVMASDIAGVLAALEGEPEFDEEFLAQMAAHEWFTRDGTLWRGMKRVPPAHWMTFSKGRVREEQHWHLPPPLSIRYRRDEDYIEHHREILDKAVRQSSRAIGPIGFEVSGGLDSSALFAVADRLGLDDIHGYALAGPKGTKADETEYIRALAEHLGREINLNPLFMPGLEWFLSRARADRDMAYFPNGAMMFGLYSAMARDGARVAINGLGGDEWLGGNPPHYLESLQALDWRQFGRSLAADVKKFGLIRATRFAVRSSVRPLVGRLLLSGQRRRRRRVSSKLEQLPWMTGEARRLLNEGLLRREEAIANSSGNEKAATLLNYPINSILLDHSSRLRSLAGIEGRSPLLSREIIAFSAATTDAIRLRAGFRKYAHRIAMSGDLPPAILERKTKAEFGITFDKAFGGLSEHLRTNPPIALPDAFKPTFETAISAEKNERFVDGRTKWLVWSLINMTV
ncbi:asparagine synthetase B [Erythrobacter sp. THAF29]|uniref:asparagine synthetase B family protein n=1 Tax=Erythrobacter sp. THAF29 TaxID=2587851 RepID=UPI0012689848|nr:asparagine synthase-related protein [Erythrobacter sp. THAF29]QFT78285.1 Asparagine synthetase [glutamine-hydrolyzing] 3 [Erythrobacter sp. THAF29]